MIAFIKKLNESSSDAEQKVVKISASLTFTDSDNNNGSRKKYSKFYAEIVFS